MIKRIVIIILFCLVILTSYVFIIKNKQEGSLPSNEAEQITPTIQFPSNPQGNPTSKPRESGDYWVNYLIVRPTDIIELYSNLEEKLTSSEIRSKYSCLSLVSGGFYTTEQKHIGLFYTQDKLINPEQQSNLFNGFFTIDADKKSSITKSAPSDLSTLRIALQAGPVLYYGNKPQLVTTTTDEFARRILVARSNRGEITFISLSTKNNPVSGPKLSELPGIIKNLNASTGLNITDALNLDGGAHSTFITDSANLGELSTIGSFFCIKPKD